MLKYEGNINNIDARLVFSLWELRFMGVQNKVQVRSNFVQIE
jgi:hypothetical protein